ncbi:MAG: cupin domain-containing protein, partial [Acidobacteriota bacterium]|nr:cupin domain-containing protein [Acidobacteriota bacterium]
DPIIVRAGERAGARVSHKAGAAGGFEYFPLGRGKTDRHMEPFYIEIAGDAPAQVSTHEGEEFIVVISGEVVLEYGGVTGEADESMTLQTGDSAYYNSVVPHTLKAVGDKPASIYAIVLTPF